jgi:hypothetical protein
MKDIDKEEVAIKIKLLRKLENMKNTETYAIVQLEYDKLFEKDEKDLLCEAQSYLPNETETDYYDISCFIEDAIDEITTELDDLDIYEDDYEKYLS